MIKHQIVIFSWHPPGITSLSSGGFKRLSEILSRTDTSVQVFDSFPTLYADKRTNTVKVIEYQPFPYLSRITIFSSLLAGLIDRIWSTIQLIVLAIRLPIAVTTIYVPFSELPHLSMAAVICKMLINAKLVFCNLNVNVISPERVVNNVLHKFADRVITLSRDLQSDLSKQGITAKYINGVGFDKPKLESKNQKRVEYTAYFCGRHTSEKGFFDLLKIWKNILEISGQNYKLVTIGNIHPSQKRQIFTEIDNLGIKGTIKLLGEVSDQQKNETIAASQICLFPSKFEGWGIVPMEALSLGVPVIAYDLPVYKESIGKCTAFRTAPTGDLNYFVKLTLDTLSNSDYYRKSALVWKPVQDWSTVADAEWKIICQD